MATRHFFGNWFAITKEKIRHAIRGTTDALAFHALMTQRGTTSRQINRYRGCRMDQAACRFGGHTTLRDFAEPFVLLRKSSSPESTLAEASRFVTGLSQARDQ